MTHGLVPVPLLRCVTGTDQAFVEWSSTWTESGGGVAVFCNPIYRALLDALKAHFA